MRTGPKLIVVLVAFAAFMGSADRMVQAAGATPAVQAQTQTPKAMTGELQSVDVDDMSFIVKMPNASMQTFLYTEQTVVTGADKGAAGLVTMNGMPVTVYFRIEGSAKIATRIEVDPTAQQG
jgi:hypothetical protein